MVPRASDDARTLCDELTDDLLYDPATGRVFREWVSVAVVDRYVWQQLLADAVDFARQEPAP